MPAAAFKFLPASLPVAVLPLGDPKAKTPAAAAQPAASAKTPIEPKEDGISSQWDLGFEHGEVAGKADAFTEPDQVPPEGETEEYVAAWWAAMPAYTHAPTPQHAPRPMYSTWYSYHLDIKKEHLRFSSRLDEFMQLSNAAVVAPGGLGTLLELFYTWQLVQVEHICETPIILLGTHYKGLLSWIKEHLLKEKLDGRGSQRKPASRYQPGRQR